MLGEKVVVLEENVPRGLRTAPSVKGSRRRKRVLAKDALPCMGWPVYDFRHPSPTFRE